MKFLANENIPNDVCRILKNNGIDIISISDIKYGLNDLEVINLAKKQNRIILTFDKDFGELTFNQKTHVKGILLLRIRPKSVTFILNRIMTLLNTPKIHIENNFVVLEENKVRIRKIN